MVWFNSEYFSHSKNDMLFFWHISGQFNEERFSCFTLYICGSHGQYNQHLASWSVLYPFRLWIGGKRSWFPLFKYLRHRAHLQLFLTSSGQTSAPPLHMGNFATEAMNKTKLWPQKSSNSWFHLSSMHNKFPLLVYSYPSGSVFISACPFLHSAGL